MAKQNPDPFYEWIDHEAIRDLVHRAHELESGDRLILIEGLVPCLVDDLGNAGFEEFLSEIQTKARRYEEARAHPGETDEE